MTAGRYSSALLFFGFLVCCDILHQRCAATTPDDSIKASTKSAADATTTRSSVAAPPILHPGTGPPENADTDETTMAVAASSPAAVPATDGARRRADASGVDTASERATEATHVSGDRATPSGRASRGKIKFGDGGRANDSARADGARQALPAPTTLSESGVSRSLKSNGRHGNGGYQFEGVTHPEQRRGDAGYERYSVVDETDDNIDARRNYNTDGGGRRAEVVDVVKPPQGFALKPPPPLAAPPHDQSFERTSATQQLRYSSSRVSPPTQFTLAKRVSADVPRPVADSSKNEILRKPSFKPVAASSGSVGAVHLKTGGYHENHVGSGPTDGHGKSSLPTTSAAWALAAMRTTDGSGSKQWRQPAPVVPSVTSILTKKNGLLGKEAAMDTDNGLAAGGGNSVGSGGHVMSGMIPPAAVKPFTPWAVRLQKTTTESAKVLSTTAESSTTISPDNMAPSISYAEPKLSKTAVTRKGTVLRGDSEEKHEKEEPNAPSTPAIANSTSASDPSVTPEIRVSSSSPPRQPNASSTDIVQNDVGSMFDREDGDYSADQPSRDRVDPQSSSQATSTSTVGSVAAGDAIAGVSWTPATTNDSHENSVAVPELERGVESSTTSNDVAMDMAGSEESDDGVSGVDGQGSANSTMLTSIIVPLSGRDTNSSSEYIEGTSSTSEASNLNGSMLIVMASDNQTTLGHLANGSFVNDSTSAADFMPATSESSDATTSRNSSSTTLPPTYPLEALLDTSTKSTSTAGYSSHSFAKDDDSSMSITITMDTDVTTTPNWLNLTSSPPVTKPTNSTPVTTTRLPFQSPHSSTRWATFIATQRTTSHTTTAAQTTSTTTTVSMTVTAPTSPATTASTTVTVPTTQTPITAPTHVTITTSPTTPATVTIPTSPRTPSTTHIPTPTSPTTWTTTTAQPSTTSSPTRTPGTTQTTSTVTPPPASTTKMTPSTTSRTTAAPTTRTTEPSSTLKPQIGANVPGYLKLVFKTTVADICETSTLKENLIQFITQRSLRVQSKDQVVMMIDPQECREPSHSTRSIPVALYVVNEYGGYDRSLVEEMKSLLEEDNLANNTLPIHEIVFRENVPNTSRVIAAIVITSIAAVSFVLLVFLMCAIRSRHKTNYGQRCTPVSVDDYNLDNISEYNSVRRRGHFKMSRRSYSNPSFDDPVSPSKALTLQGLTKAIENRPALDDEFSRIPTIGAKAEELPAGVDVKNRYANVIPLPETRVSLDPDGNCTESADDYINANYVKGFKGTDKFYIACQAPLADTIRDFWKMVWNEQTKIIIMLTGLTENGIEKCADYLPPSEVLDCHRLFGDYQITLKKREVKEKYVISSLQLKNMETNLWREVTHLWYTNWPAQGVPSEQSSIIAFLIEARAYMRNSKGPHVVHCSPGTGRTGTVIAIDICIRDYESSRTVNVPATVCAIRRCRAGAVQTKEQYAFIYKVLVLYAKKLNGGTALDSM